MTVLCNCDETKPGHCHHDHTVSKVSPNDVCHGINFPQFNIVPEKINTKQFQSPKECFTKCYAESQSWNNVRSYKDQMFCVKMRGRGCSNVAPLLLWPGSGIFWGGRL